MQKVAVRAVAKLTHDVAEMEGDSLFVLTAEELANEWKSEGFNVGCDVFVVETRDGRLVGSEEFYNEGSHNERFDNPNFDPTLWMIAWDGYEVAGFSQNRFRKGIGWIGTIAVRRPWRKKGLGIALLRHTFGEFYKRGTTTIGLGVDSANLIGATRLYQRVGMYMAGEFAMYEKELRDGG